MTYKRNPKRNCSNWLSSYMKINQNNEAPLQYHLWAGIMALSTVMERRCCVDAGFSTLFPNFYVFLIGPTGGRKTISMDLIQDFFHEIGIELGADALGSSQALYKEFNDMSACYFDESLKKEIEHKSLSVWSGEIQNYLASADVKFIAALTELFDCKKIWKYKSMKQKTINVNNCWLTIIGAITPNLLQMCMNHQMVGGGLLSRFICVVAYGKRKKIAFPYSTDEERKIEQNLIKDLANIYKMHGKFTIHEDVFVPYKIWYESSASESCLDNNIFAGYDERRAMYVWKLCMILSISESNDFMIKLRHYHLALEILEYTEAEMPNAFYGVGNGRHSTLLTAIIQRIQHNQHMTWKEILLAFSLDAFAKDIHECLDTLVATEQIKMNHTPSGEVRYVVNTVKQHKKERIYLDELLKGEY